MTGDRDLDRLYDEVKQAVHAADQIPATVDEFAHSVFDLGDVDAIVADLVYDSLVDADATRAAEPMRQLTFRTSSLEVAVTVVDEERRELLGQLVPPQPAAVTLRTRDGEAHTEADELGRFSFEDVPAGPATLAWRLEAEGAATVTSDWLVL